MIEGMPWPIQIGVASLGWSLFAACVWLFYRKLSAGDLMTRREGDAKDAQINTLTARAEKAEGANEALVKQNGELMEMARLGTATWQALRKAADG